jgi:hypothetical protein
MGFGSEELAHGLRWAGAALIAWYWAAQGAPRKGVPQVREAYLGFRHGVDQDSWFPILDVLCQGWETRDWLLFPL